MKATLVAFGDIQIAANGMAATWSSMAENQPPPKGPSKTLREQFGHTPLSAAETIPWGGQRLIVGTGADGRLPIAHDVHAEAERRGVRIAALPTSEAWRLLTDMRSEDVYAVPHVTC
jgi:hypothetical protein